MWYFIIQGASEGEWDDVGTMKVEEGVRPAGFNFMVMSWIYCELICDEIDIGCCSCGCLVSGC